MIVEPSFGTKAPQVRIFKYFPRNVEVEAWLLGNIASEVITLDFYFITLYF